MPQIHNDTAVYGDFTSLSVICIIAVYDTLYNYVQTILATFKLTTLNYLVELILIVNNGNQRCFLTFKSKMFINLLTTPMQYHFSSCGVCNVMIFLSDIYRDPHGDLNLFELELDRVVGWHG